MVNTIQGSTTEQATISMTIFGVRGSCNMCKKTIKKAANSVKGVSKANWNKDKKIMMQKEDHSGHNH